MEWETGEDNLLIVSSGTGRRDKKLIGEKWNNLNLLNLAQCSPEQFMSDANELIELMMHFVGKGTGPLRKIDSEVENLSEDSIHGGKAFSYLRYNVEVVRNELDKIGISGLSDLKITNLMNMDLAENVNLLIEIGKKAAKRYVEQGNLPDPFNLKPAG